MVENKPFSSRQNKICWWMPAISGCFGCEEKSVKGRRYCIAHEMMFMAHFGEGSFLDKTLASKAVAWENKVCEELYGHKNKRTLRLR